MQDKNFKVKVFRLCGNTQNGLVIYSHIAGYALNAQVLVSTTPLAYSNAIIDLFWVSSHTVLKTANLKSFTAFFEQPPNVMFANNSPYMVLH